MSPRPAASRLAAAALPALLGLLVLSVASAAPASSLQATSSGQRAHAAELSDALNADLAQPADAELSAGPETRVRGSGAETNVGAWVFGGASAGLHPGKLRWGREITAGDAFWYDPTSGLFLSEDPVQGDLFDPSTLHVWGYANANPISVIDPRGMLGTERGWERHAEAQREIGDQCFNKNDPANCAFIRFQAAIGLAGMFGPAGAALEGTGLAATLGSLGKVVVGGSAVVGGLSLAHDEAGGQGVPDVASVLAGQALGSTAICGGAGEMSGSDRVAGCLDTVVAVSPFAVGGGRAAIGAGERMWASQTWLRPRLRPGNWAVSTEGLGSNFGNVRVRYTGPDRLADSTFVRANVARSEAVRLARDRAGGWEQYLRREASDGAARRWTSTLTPWQRQAFQRSDIDWDLIRPAGAAQEGLSNWEGAVRGYAPGRFSPSTGKWEDVILHHLNQGPRSGVVELWRSTHGRVPHLMFPPGPWRKSRPDWAKAWTREQAAYWRWRVGEYDPVPTDRLRLPGD